MPNWIGIANGIGTRYNQQGALLNLGLLDKYGGAAAAYSLRKLSKNYSGPAIRVRRSSDNAEQDIGFVGTSLDTTTLLAFVGSGNGFVTKWYDQSGLSKNALQTILQYQPSIASSGTLRMNNGSPAVYFDGTDDSLDLSSLTITTNLSLMSSFIVFSTIDVNKTQVVLSLSSYLTNARWYAPFLTTGVMYASYANLTTAINCGTATLNQALFSLCAGSTNAISRVNGTLKGSIASQSVAVDKTGTSIGRYDSAYLKGYVSEIIIYASDKNGIADLIESEMNSHYSIY